MVLKSIKTLDDILENLAINNEYRFNAYQIASISNEKDVDAVNEYLLHRSDSKYGILTPKVETLCPNNHPDKHFDFGIPLPVEEVECRICEEIYVPDLNFSHIVFYFKSNYKDEVKRIKKKFYPQILMV